MVGDLKGPKRNWESSRVGEGRRLFHSAVWVPGRPQAGSSAVAGVGRGSVVGRPLDVRSRIGLPWSNRCHVPPSQNGLAPKTCQQRTLEGGQVPRQTAVAPVAAVGTATVVLKNYCLGGAGTAAQGYQGQRTDRSCHSFGPSQPQGRCCTTTGSALKTVASTEPQAGCATSRVQAAGC
jgi:hypothetical protein